MQGAWLKKALCLPESSCTGAFVSVFCGVVMSKVPSCCAANLLLLQGILEGTQKVIGARERHRVPPPDVLSHQVADSGKHLLASLGSNASQDLSQGATGRQSLPQPHVLGELDSESPFEFSRSKLQETWQQCNQHSKANNAYKVPTSLTCNQHSKADNALRCPPH
jgi:hypothetical protein